LNKPFLAGRLTGTTTTTNFGETAKA